MTVASERLSEWHQKGRRSAQGSCSSLTTAHQTIDCDGYAVFVARQEMWSACVAPPSSGPGAKFGTDKDAWLSSGSAKVYSVDRARLPGRAASSKAYRQRRWRVTTRRAQCNMDGIRGGVWHMA